MSALDEMRNEYEKRLAALKQTALAAVGHVGFANYEHRERAASQIGTRAIKNMSLNEPGYCASKPRKSNEKQMVSNPRRYLWA